MPRSPQLPADALESVRVHRDSNMVHAANGLAGQWHRVLRKVEEGQAVAVADVEEEVGRAGQVPILEQLGRMHHSSEGLLAAKRVVPFLMPGC